MTDGQPSLTSLEVSGQGAWPVCLSQLSPDSACSEGSTGSVDQQQDTGQCDTFTQTPVQIPDILSVIVTVL